MPGQADIGLIGLGVMGRNLALNIADHGYTVAVYNRTGETTSNFVAGAPDTAGALVACHGLAELVHALAPPRAILLMVQAGPPVDDQIAALRPLLGAGDTIIDGGNAHYRDTIRRHAELAVAGRHFLGVGVSGGEEGARHGPSIMVGGPAETYDRVAHVLRDIAARAGGEPCCARLGDDGAGHFVKTMHNGIEYADMQMIAEAYFVLRHGSGLSDSDIRPVFEAWNAGDLGSYLMEITGDILATTDPDTGRPILDVILDRAGQKGTGLWAAVAALELGVPAPTIVEAVTARALSALTEERHEAERRLAGARKKAADHDDPTGVLGDALLAGKICAYAQGFAILAAASRHFGWGLDLARIARVWRAGCIIRARILDAVAHAYDRAPELANLLVDPYFAEVLTRTEAGLRDAVGLAAGCGLPVPALASALGYFDGYRSGRLWANLIQAQRDRFGAHTFERVDRPGAFHHPWSDAKAEET